MSVEYSLRFEVRSCSLHPGVDRHVISPWSLVTSVHVITETCGFHSDACERYKNYLVIIMERRVR